MTVYANVGKDEMNTVQRLRGPCLRRGFGVLTRGSVASVSVRTLSHGRVFQSSSAAPAESAEASINLIATNDSHTKKEIEFKNARRTALEHEDAKPFYPEVFPRLRHRENPTPVPTLRKYYVENVDERANNTVTVYGRTKIRLAKMFLLNNFLPQVE
jgi:hypothetical protein